MKYPVCENKMLIEKGQSEQEVCGQKRKKGFIISPRCFLYVMLIQNDVEDRM